VGKRYLAAVEELAPNGDVKAALNGWHEHDLRRIAQEIVGLYAQVTRHMKTDD
jgi:hypothetical protein